MKEELLKALDELLNEYDAYYFMNKYDNFESNKCTHHKQFMLLKDFVKDDKLGNNALNWIRFTYDCYYKEEILGREDTAFSYLKELIEKGVKMNREEVKKELLNDKEIQFQSAIVATFTALYQQLIKKEIFTDKDVDEINENTEKIVDTLNETLIDKNMKARD